MKASKSDLEDLFPVSKASQKYKFYREQILKDLKILNDNMVILTHLRKYIENYYLASNLFRGSQYFLQRCYLNTYQTTILIAHRVWNETRKDAICFSKYVKHIKKTISLSSSDREKLFSQIEDFEIMGSTGVVKDTFEDIAKLRNKLLAHGNRELLIEDEDKACLGLITRQLAVKHPNMKEVKLAAKFLNEFFHLLDFTTLRSLNTCVELLDQIALSSSVIAGYDEMRPLIWKKTYQKSLRLRQKDIALLNEVRQRNGLTGMKLSE